MNDTLFEIKNLIRAITQQWKNDVIVTKIFLQGYAEIHNL